RLPGPARGSRRPACKSGARPTACRPGRTSRCAPPAPRISRWSDRSWPERNAGSPASLSRHSTMAADRPPLGRWRIQGRAPGTQLPKDASSLAVPRLRLLTHANEDLVFAEGQHRARARALQMHDHAGTVLEPQIAVARRAEPGLARALRVSATKIANIGEL